MLRTPPEMEKHLLRSCAAAAAASFYTLCGMRHVACGSCHCSQLSENSCSLAKAKKAGHSIHID